MASFFFLGSEGGGGCAPRNAEAFFGVAWISLRIYEMEEQKEDKTLLTCERAKKTEKDRGARESDVGWAGRG